MSNFIKRKDCAKCSHKCSGKLFNWKTTIKRV